MPGIEKRGDYKPRSQREKQAYRLTAEGRKQLHLELDRMRQLARAGARLKTKEASS